MRPATRFILSAPFGDFPFVKRILPECKRLMPTWPDELLVRLIKLICFETADRTPDDTFLRTLQNRYRGYTPAEAEEHLFQQLAEKEIYQSDRYGVPIYTSTSSWWKGKQYGLLLDQLTSEVATERSPSW